MAYTDDDIAALDDAVKKKLNRDWKNDTGYEGMRVFLDGWSSGQTIDEAQKLVRKFGLEGRIGAFERVSEAFSKIKEILEEEVLPSLNQRSKLTWPDGPEYSVGQDRLKFGLIFTATPKDLNILRKRFPARKEAAAESAKPIQRAINLIKKVDFGNPDESGIVHLEEARDILQEAGLDNAKLKLAIRYFLTQRPRAKELIYGPSKVGSDKGVLDELIEQLELPVIAAPQRSRQMSQKNPEHIQINGAVYQRVTGYHLPDKMKGVGPCRPQDQTDEKGKDEQVYCVWDWKKNLRGRFKNLKDALRHKVFMIQRGLKGKGKKVKK